MIFNKTINDLKAIFKMTDNNITERNVNSPFKYEYTLKRIEAQLTNFIVYLCMTLKHIKQIEQDLTKPNFMI